MGILHNDPRLVVVVAELGGAHALALAEDAVEVAQVVEPAAVAYLGDRVGAVDELSAGIAQTEVDDVIAEGSACMELEEPAER